MTRMIRLVRNQSGAVTIEFALIGPALIAMMLAVLQFGIGMQNYNSLRSASAEVARFAVVNTLAKTKLPDSELQNTAYSIATSSPYNLIPARLEITVQDAATQRVAGATEKTISMTYRIPTMLSFFGMQDIPLTYNRPIFLTASSTTP